MMTAYIVDLESLETRYTAQWKTHVPEMLQRAGVATRIIEGPYDIPPATSPGAFLNFGGTNIYKSVQVEKISRLFCDNAVKAGDYFLFTDAWHPGIINLKYMSELLKIPVKIGALWHAGSYDPADFLGRLIGNTPWVRHAEKAFFSAIDHNYFATDFHVRMFMENLLNDGMTSENPWWEDDLEHRYDSGKIIRTGWPMDYMSDTLSAYKGMEKRDLILFPHRVAPEKQVEIFRDLARRLPQYEFIVCQDTSLTKHEYHKLLGQAKIVFSASLQETLGIGCYEGALVGALPMVPGRLSYSEMYADTFKYPSIWTESFGDYNTNQTLLINMITARMSGYNAHLPELKDQTNTLTKEFFTATKLVETILQSV